LVATTIKQYAWVLAAIVALSAALAVLSPGIAEAQSPEDTVLVSTLPESDTQVQDNAAIPQQQPVVYEPATLRVVNPGDSLWAISQERLQPDPTPEQIMNEVGRIYELNQDLIGNDPNLIFAGQELLLPPVVVAKFPVSEEPETPGSGVSEPVTASEPAVSEELVPPEPAVSGEPAASQESETSEPGASEPATAEQVTKPVNDPDALSGRDSADEEPIYNNHKVDRLLQGLAVLAGTLAIAILMVWKLPMRRDVDDPMVWRIPRGYYGYYEDQRSGTASESLETAQGPDSPTGTENAAPASATSEEMVYQPLSTRRRWERLRRIQPLSARRRRERLRRIHQRTIYQRRPPPAS
jgi:LysM domain-containing protein